MITVRDHGFEVASDAGRDVRPFGCSVHEHGRPVGLAEPDGSEAPTSTEKDFDLGLKSLGWCGFAPLPVVLRRSGDLSEEPRTRSHLELGR